MDALVVSITRLHGYVVVRVAGELDLVTKPLLYGSVEAAVRAYREGLLVIELSAVSFMDAQGLSALVMSRRHAIEHQRELALAGASAAVRRLLHITALSSSFTLMAAIDTRPGHPGEQGHPASPASKSP
ncbi:STAS domain-containing protein [Nonomuraea sp. NPDC002799]